MRLKKGWVVVFTLIGIVALMVTVSRARWTVKGQLIDAETDKPIEGAVIAISWTEVHGFGLKYWSTVEDAETISDAQGYFTVPKYSTFFTGKEFLMKIYKKGYVCWDSRIIFPSDEKRKDFSLRSGMKIRLEPFKEHYSREAHALFATMSASVLSSKLFKKAIKSEEELRDEIFRREEEKKK